MNASPASIAPNLPQTDISRSLFQDIYNAHTNLKAVEAKRAHDADLRFCLATGQKVVSLHKYAKQHNPGMGSQVEGFLEDTTKEQAQLIASANAGAEGEFHQIQQQFLKTVKAGIIHLSNGGCKIVYEVDNSAFINAARKLKELNNMLPSGVKIPQKALEMIDAEIVGHQDPFNEVIFRCVQEQMAVFSYHCRIAESVAVKEGPQTIPLTPKLKASMICHKTFSNLRVAIEEARLKDEMATLDNAVIKKALIAFAETFAVVKKMGMDESVGQLTQSIMFLNDCFNKAKR